MPRANGCLYELNNAIYKTRFCLISRILLVRTNYQIITKSIVFYHKSSPLRGNTVHETIKTGTVRSRGHVVETDVQRAYLLHRQSCSLFDIPCAIWLGNVKTSLNKRQINT